MKPMYLTAGAAALAFAVGGAAAVFAQEAPAPAESATLGTTSTETLGAFLVDEQGRSLYLFTNDNRGTSTTAPVSNCTGGCIDAWPAATLGAGAMPSVGGMANPALVSTMTREDGTVQLVYNGYPLYRYALDTEAGQANGQGVGEAWYLVSPEGWAVGQPVPADAAPPPASVIGGSGQPAPAPLL